MIYKRTVGGGATYHLTAAGEELRPIVELLGHWARKWITRWKGNRDCAAIGGSWCSPARKKTWTSAAPIRAIR